jgi:hypothetical protein
MLSYVGIISRGWLLPDSQTSSDCSCLTPFPKFQAHRRPWTSNFTSNSELSTCKPFLLPGPFLLSSVTGSHPLGLSLNVDFADYFSCSWPLSLAVHCIKQLISFRNYDSNVYLPYPISHPFYFTILMGFIILFSSMHIISTSIRFISPSPSLFSPCSS